MQRVSPKYKCIDHNWMKKAKEIIFNDKADVYVLAFLIT